MLGRLLILFVCIPLIELGLLILVSNYTGLPFTLSLVLITGLLGASLSRSQGLKAWKSVQTELRSGRMPSDSLFDGMMILLAGAFLITPGILTDIVGFSLLTPPFRRILQRYLMKRIGVSLSMKTPSGTWAKSNPNLNAGSQQTRQPGEDVIDVEFQEHDD
jgi:UPF0716 protein FxsA